MKTLDIIPVRKFHRDIIIKCVLVIILICTLFHIPMTWVIKKGMTQREFDVAYTDASERALNSNEPEERQSALSDIQALKKYEESGKIGLKKDVSWMVTVARFFIIVAILSLCWSLIVKIRKEFRKPKPLKLKMEKSTYKKLFPNKKRTLSELESQAHRLRSL